MGSGATRQEISLLEDAHGRARDAHRLAAAGRFIGGTCGHDDVREPWVSRQRGQRRAVRRSEQPLLAARARGAAQRAQLQQKRSRLLECSGRRRGEPREAEDVGLAHASSPCCELQRQWREVGVENLGTRLRREARLLALAPQAVGDARGDAAGASRALRGRGSGDGARGER